RCCGWQAITSRPSAGAIVHGGRTWVCLAKAVPIAVRIRASNHSSRSRTGAPFPGRLRRPAQVVAAEAAVEARHQMADGAPLEIRMERPHEAELAVRTTAIRAGDLQWDEV